MQKYYMLDVWQVDKNKFCVPTTNKFELNNDKEYVYCYIFNGNQFNFFIEYQYGKCIPVKDFEKLNKYPETYYISDTEYKSIKELNLFSDVEKHIHVVYE